MYKSIIKPFLFLFDPENIHHFTFNFLRFIHKIPGVKSLLKSIFNYEHPSLEREIFGIKFKNPIGLAAGFDKDAVLYNELSSFGFGFIEIGTVTPVAQDGNPKKRLFRLPEDQGLINRMGFNNGGVKKVVANLRGRNKDLIIGGNIGKNKLTPNDEAFNDYLICFDALFEHVDYFVVNVSSPNTPNLRDLQEKEPLKQLLSSLMIENRKRNLPKPILLKIAPDLNEGQLDDIIEIVLESEIDGVIASNTTISRDNLNTYKDKLDTIGAGGLSGKPLEDKSTKIIRYLSNKSNKAFPIIGVGGIHDTSSALEKINAGASLIQLYTGFIYEGPILVKKINQALVRKLN